MNEITSIKDPKIILCKELTTSAGRKLNNKVLLLGEEQINWAIRFGLPIEFIITLSKTDLPKSLKNIPVFQTGEGILKKATDTNYVIPIIAVSGLIKTVLHDSPDFVIVFDDVIDFGNIGTIVRSANSFGINFFLATSNTFDPFQKKAIDASRGGVFQSNFKYFETPEQTIKFLKNKGYQIIATSPHASHLQSQTPLNKKPMALILGNETRGISQEIIDEADMLIQIPMLGQVESLNVGVAAGISMYELKFKMVLLMLKEKIFDNLGRQINVTGKLIQMAFDKKIKAVTDLDGMQIILLMIMHLDEKMTLNQISKDVGLFGKELEFFLKPLIDRELIKEIDNFWRITNQGQQFLAEIWPIVEQTNEEILDGITNVDRKILQELLDRLQNSCLKILEK